MAFVAGHPEFLFTENETNALKAFNLRNRTPYVKDAFHEYIIHGNKAAVNPAMTGTKLGAHYVLQLETRRIRDTENAADGLQSVERDGLSEAGAGTSLPPGEGNAHQECRATNDFGARYDEVFAERRKEADEFYDSRFPKGLSEDARLVMRQAYAGMLWSKQFYHFDVRTWLEGDPAGPRASGRPMEGAKQGVAASVQRRHHFYAGQVGVSVVRGVGPGVSLHAAGHRRSGLREGTTDPAASRMVHAPERAIAGL